MAHAKKIIETDVGAFFQPYEHFCKVMLDAYILIDNKGTIIKANPLFAQLVGKSTKQILKSGSLGDMIQFFIQDKPYTIADILKENAPTRIDEVRGKSDTYDDLNLIISIFPFIDGKTNAHTGSFVLIRDVTAEKNLHDKYKNTAIKSITDSLTELFTRRYFEDYLELHYKRLLAMPDSSAHQLAIVMVDIDFFKKVNDQYGHQAGDFVLKSVGKIMKNTFRKTDLPCRYGGEEFLVILPGTGLSGAVHAADKLRQAIEKERLVFENKHIPIKVSCGVAAFHPSENYSEAITRADQALYHSKESGRNRVSYHNGSLVEIFKGS